MNKHFRKVLKLLKSKVQALGFSKKEVERAAAQIADKLTLEDDASDEDVDSAIDEAIESAMPFLKLAQSSASRQLKKYRDEHETDDDDDDEPADDVDSDDDSDDDKSNRQPSSKKNSKKSVKKSVSDDSDSDEKIPSYMKTLIAAVEKQGTQIAALQGDKISSYRKAKVSSILKGTGDYGKRVLKSFGRMNFDSDDDFDDYLEEVKDDLEKENQSRANDGLEALGPVTSTDSNKVKGTNKTEVLSDDQVKALAKGEVI